MFTISKRTPQKFQTWAAADDVGDCKHTGKANFNGHVIVTWTSRTNTLVIASQLR